MVLLPAGFLQDSCKCGTAGSQQCGVGEVCLGVDGVILDRLPSSFWSVCGGLVEVR